MQGRKGDFLFYDLNINPPPHTHTLTHTRPGIFMVTTFYFSSFTTQGTNELRSTII